MSGNINSATYVRIRAQKSLLSSFEVRTIAFIIGHIPLSFLLSFSGWAGAVHAILVLFIGMRAAVHRNYDRVLAVLAYIAGAELLWRMTSARIFWEYGKYASIALAIFTILVSQKRTFGLKPDYQIKLNPALIFYLAFLLPSVVLTFDALDLNEVRRQLSFNLSGPLAITVLGLFLWQYSANRGSLVQLLLALVAPIVGILTLSAQGTLTADVLDFSQNANFVTSGGYGPNQVSNLLGLGALASLILIVLLWTRLPLRLFFMTTGAAFLLQAILTFSRGGVYSFIIAAFVFSLHLFASAKTRGRFSLLIIATSIFIILFAVPFLDNITTMAWQERFTNLDSTGRRELAEVDWQTFLQNPLTGVGVGVAQQARKVTVNSTVASHTEFSRTVAEHGLLGIVSFLILIGLLLLSYTQARSWVAKALVATFTVWSFSVMVHSGMRFVAISLLIALAMIAWQVELDEKLEETV